MFRCSNLLYLLLILSSTSLAQFVNPQVESVHFQVTDIGAGYLEGPEESVNWRKRGGEPILALQRKFVLMDAPADSNDPLVVSITIGYFENNEEFYEAWNNLLISNISTSHLQLEALGIPPDDTLYLTGGFPTYVRGVKNGFIFVLSLRGGGQSLPEGFRETLLTDVIRKLSDRIDSESTPPTPKFVWNVDFIEESNQILATVSPFEPLEHPASVKYQVHSQLDSSLVVKPVEVSPSTLDQVSFSVDTSGLEPGDYLLVVSTFDSFLFRTFSDSIEFSKSQNNDHIEILSVKDTTLTFKKPHQNEGANPVLTLEKIQGKAARSAVAFELADVDLSGLSKATLILTIDPGQHVNGWGNGRTVSVQALNAAWHEGNGKSFGYKKKDAVAGTGSGATWFSPIDENIGNDSTNSVVNWDGGAISAHPPTALPATLANHQSGTVEFDVTADLLNGAQHGWLIKQDNENVGAKVSFYSREGAAAAGNQELAPRLVLEFGAPVASAPSGSLLSRLGIGTPGNKLQPTNSPELRSLKQVLQQSPATAYATEQLLSEATRQHPLLNITTRIAYRSWLNEEPSLAALAMLAS